MDSLPCHVISKLVTTLGICLEIFLLGSKYIVFTLSEQYQSIYKLSLVSLFKKHSNEQDTDIYHNMLLEGVTGQAGTAKGVKSSV